MMYNFGCAEVLTMDWLGGDAGCHGSAKVAVMEMPESVEQVFSSVGAEFLTGQQGVMASCVSENNPCRRAYEGWDVAYDDIFEDIMHRGAGSWDTLATLLAIRGTDAAHLKIDQVGYKMLVDDEGHEDFQYNTKYNQYRIRYKDAGAAERIKNDINELLCADSAHKHNNFTPPTRNDYNHQDVTPAYEAPSYQEPYQAPTRPEAPWISCGKMYLGEC